MNYLALSFVLVLTFSLPAPADECISGDCVNGYGTYVWDDGDMYVGESVNNVAHGQGAFTYANGEKYIGEYINNERHGQGTFTWPDGEKYVGEWYNNEMIN